MDPDHDARNLQEGTANLDIVNVDMLNADVVASNLDTSHVSVKVQQQFDDEEDQNNNSGHTKDYFEDN